MNACTASSIILSLLALLPSPCVSKNNGPSAAKVNTASVYVAPAYATSVGYATEERFDDFVGPPGHNKQRGGSPGRGPPGGHGPPGLSNRGPPGHNDNLPPGWRNKGDKERPSEEERYPDTSNEGSTSPDKNKNDGPYGPDNRQQDQCRKDEFRCENNECLPSSVRCDNKVDCSDSSDEASCVMNRNEEEGCVLPPQPEGGRYELGCDGYCNKYPGDTVPERSILTYNCENNYTLQGSKIAFCVNKKWHNMPSCIKTCSALKSISVDISCSYRGETVSCSERMVSGTRARLSCKPSYESALPIYREIKCQDDGRWDRNLFYCVPKCGESISHGNTLVINGRVAKMGMFPWHVGIYKKKSDMTYEQQCGGSLITSNLVVSAAHCFYDEASDKLIDASNYAVAGGKYYRAWDKDEQYNQKSMVESIRPGSRYQGARGNFAEDIALVKLKTSFKLNAQVQPVCIDWTNNFEWKQLQLGQSGKVVGWGKNIEGKSTEILYEIDMPFVPYQQCLSTVPSNFRGYLTPDKFCAGHLNGSSLCEGDSGGGLSFEKEGIWYLRGIVSVSPVKNDFCDYHSYVAFTYISRFLDFINEAFTKELT
ncbi:PREDICTED: limulus clotting factor C-like [Dinoponera quadriceps]|uniref:Limulus clotting factor C-like n=1 Tax=Dinoponera quadriceps TaxID=609295 RepID=A0A6P3Y9S1_DINQU|nr:PREDICTED: limulus clotting factor C-like [Dinoponera quadriceps]